MPEEDEDESESSNGAVNGIANGHVNGSVNGAVNGVVYDTALESVAIETEQLQKASDSSSDEELENKVRFLGSHTLTVMCSSLI